MDQTGLPSNSLMNQSKKEYVPDIEEFKAVPVVSGKVVKTKKSLGRKFVDAFISEDITDIPTYLKKQVVIPLIKKMFLDSVNILLNGKTTNYNNSSEIRPYHRMGSGMGNIYLMGSSTNTTKSEIKNRTFNDLHYDIGADGKIVKENIEGIFNTFQKVRVADVLELSEMSDLIEYPDNNYGWTDIRDIQAIQLIYDGKGGATLKMPPAHPL